MTAQTAHSRTPRSLGVATLLALVLAGCAPAGSAPVPTFSAAPSGSSPPAAAAIPAPGSPPTEVARTDFGALTGVRTGRHAGFDRVVFEFAQTVPGYRVRYVAVPVTSDPPGKDVTLPGAAGALEVVFSPASGVDNRGTPPVQTYAGPDRIAGLDTLQVTALVEVGDVKLVLTWAVGLRAPVPYTVTTLAGPPRVVIEVQHARG